MLKDEQILELNSTEYGTIIRKAGTIREFEINNSYGIRDYFWNYRKKYGVKISEQLFTKIIKDVILAFIEELKNDAYVVFPLGFGFLRTAYIKHSVTFVNGKVKVNGIVDWVKTINLWYENTEARDNKQLVYRDKGICKIIKYTKSGNVFKNKKFLCLDIKRSLYKQLTDDYINKHTIKPIIYG